MTAFDNSKMIVLTGGVRTTSTGVTPGELAAQVDALTAVASSEAAIRAAADTALTTEMRDGRVWTASGSMLTPSGIVVPTGVATVITRSTATNRYRMWRRATAPTDGVETDILVKDASGQWWARVQDYDAASLAVEMQAALLAEATARANADTALITEIRDGRVWTAPGSLLSPAGIAIPDGATTIMTRSTYSNQFRFWRRSNAPADGIETETLVMAANNVWCRLMRDYDMSTLEAEVRDGRVWTASGSLLTPAGATPPTSTDMIICRTTGTNVISFWRPDAGPANGIATTTYVQDSTGQWWKMVWSSSVTTFAETVPTPYLATMADANKATFELVDKSGDILAPGMAGRGIREEVARIRYQVEGLSKRLTNCIALNVVTDLGCDPSGRTDCAEIINRALRKLARNRRAFGWLVTLYFPDGDYRLDDAIRPFSGQSFTLSPRARLLPYSWYSAFEHIGWPLSSFDYLADCVFEGGFIECENQTKRTYPTYTGAWVGTKAMYIQKFRNTHFLNMRASNSFMSAFGIDFPDRSSMINCSAEGAGRYALSTGSTSQPGSSGIGIGTGWLPDEQLLILGCRSKGAGNYGYFDEKQATGFDYWPTGIKVIGFTADSNRLGIGIAGSTGTILANSQIFGSGEAGVILDGGSLAGGPAPGRRAVIVGNDIWGNGGPGIEMDCSVKAGPLGYHSSGNSIWGNGGAGHRYIGHASATTDDLSIGDDTIYGNAGGGVVFDGGRLTNVDMDGTRLINNTGAALTLNANIRAAAFHDLRMRDIQTIVAQAQSIVGTGALTDVDFDGCQNVGGALASLTGALTRVTYGRNPGVFQ